MRSHLFFLCSFWIFFLTNCHNSPSPTNPPVRLISVPDIDPSTIGNMRIAIVGKKKGSNLVLVNQSNQDYLTSPEKNKPLAETPPGELQYSAAYLSFRDQSVVVLVEDEVMAKLVALVDQLRFYEYARPCSGEEIVHQEWPERDCILVESNRRSYALMREENLFDSARRATKVGEIYLTLKRNVFEAQRLGCPVLQTFSRRAR